MPQGISGNSDVDSSVLDKLVNKLDEVIEKQQVINKTRVTPKGDVSEIQRINDELASLEDKLLKQQKTDLELFETKSVQKTISKAQTMLDGFFDKINNKGKDLTPLQTKNFLESFQILKKYSEKFGVDLTSKYQSIFDEMMRNANMSFGSLGEQAIKHAQVMSSEFNNMLEQAKKNANNTLQYDLYDANIQASQKMYTEQRNALLQQKQSIQENAQAFADAERMKREEAESTRDVIKNQIKDLMHSMLSQVGDGQYVDINYEEFAKFQQQAYSLIEIMQNLGFEVKDVQELVEQFSSKVYVPKSIIDKEGIKTLEDAKLRIQELETELQNIKTANSELLTTDDVEKIYAQHADHILEYEHTIEGLRTQIEELELELRNSVNMFDWDRKCEEVERLTQEVSELRDQLNNIRIENEELINENRDLQSIRGNAQNIYDNTSSIQQEGEITKNVTEQKKELATANQEVVESEQQFANTTRDASASVESSINNVFKTDAIVLFIQKISEISDHLNSIKQTLGTVDESNGFKNIISNIDILLEKLDEVYAKIGTGVYNLTVNQGVDKEAQKSNEEVKEYTRKTVARYQSAYDKLVKNAGGEELLFSYINNIINGPGGVSELQNLYSSLSVSKLKTSEEKVYRLISFFKILRQAAQDENFGLDMSGISIPSGSDSTFRSRIRELSGISKGKQAENVLDINKDKLGLNDVVDKLNEIKQVLNEISNKDYFGDTLNSVSSKLDDIVLKFENIVSSVKVINENPIDVKQVAHDNNSNNVTDINNIQTEVKEVTEAVEKEKKKFDELKEKISKAIPDAIKKKNEAFKDEAELVSKLVSGESEDIGNIQNAVDGVTDAVKDSQKATKDTSVGNNTQNSNTSDKKKKSYQKIRRQSAEKRAAQNTEKKSNIDRLLNEQYDAYQKIWNIRKQIAKLNPNKNAEEISELNNQKDILIKIYAQRTKELKALDETANSEAQNNSLLKLRRNTLAEIATIEAKRNDKMFSSAESKASDLLKKVDTLRNSGKYTQEFISELNSAEIEISAFLNELKNGSISFDDIDSRITSLADNVENTLAKKAFGSVKQAAEKSLTNIGLKIDQIIAKNSAMGNEFKSKFNALKTALDSAESIEDVRKIVAEVNRLESEIIRVGKTGNSFIDQIKQRLRDMNSKYIAQYFSFQDIIRYARQAVTNVIQLNDAFVELSKVSDTSLKQLESDFQSYADIAKDIGATITDTINATADWARMGYSVPDSKQLAEVAVLYKNVGDGISIDDANSSLISTLQGYQMQADEAEHIVDVFNEVANNYAIDTAGIGEALQRSASSLNAANTSLEESVALVTAANAVVQNPESVGTTFKTNFYVFMYSNMHIEYI